MTTATRQSNFLLPVGLLEEIKKHVSKREQSKFVAEALRKELKRLKLKKAIESFFGAWKDADHPELKDGAEVFVHKMRKSSRTGRSK